MASAVEHRARSRKRAEHIVETRTSVDVLRLHAKAEDEFDFIFADELMRAVAGAASNEQRYALTPAGEAFLKRRDARRKHPFERQDAKHVALSGGGIAS
jgi:hypothetical protein